MLKCFTVDDSKVQLKVLSTLIRKHPSLSLEGEFTNALDVKAALKNTKVDLIFLDIRLPDVSGFDLLDSLDEKPQVIVVSANKNFAYEAFEHEASAFLVKPIDEEKFKKVVNRALLLHENIFSEQEFDEEKDIIYIKSNLINRKVKLTDIKWIEAVGDYVKVVTDTDNYIVLSTMKGFISRLPHDRFARIHKSYIVNLKRIKKFNTKFVMIEDSELPLSRFRKKELFEKLKAN